MRQPDLEQPERRFLVELPRGRTLHPYPDDGGVYRVRVAMRASRIRLHPDLPATPVWGYQGIVPGPRIEVPAGQRVEVTWINELTGRLPLRGVRGAGAGQGTAGTGPRDTPDPQPDRLRPWTVVHLHGGRTDPDSDGWGENLLGTGQHRTVAYREDRARLLWYHDHTAAAARLTVLAGLSGLYVVRDATDRLLPRDVRELFLVLADRNLDTGDRGELDGRLLHKTGDLDGGPVEFFGPFTTVNGVLWPRCSVERAQYRVRLLNASNARTYRLTLVDDAGRSAMSRVTVVGTDGGLLPLDPTAPVCEREHLGPVGLAAGDALLLAPAERLDLVVDFRGDGGPWRFVNDAAAPWDGTSTVRLRHHDGYADAADPTAAEALRGRVADVLRFVPAGGTPDDGFDLPAVVAGGRWPRHRRYARDRQPYHRHERRTVALVEDGAGTVTLNELYRPEEAAALGDREYLLRRPYLTLRERERPAGPPRTVTYATAASVFLDAVTFMVIEGGYELWRLVNLTGATRPVHLHLVQFQLLDRVPLLGARGWDPTANADPVGAVNQLVTALEPTGAAPGPGTDAGAGPGPGPRLGRTDWGWKDTVRVDPGEMVSLMARFAGHPGRFTYRCHLLEHQDLGTVRPFVVVPAELAPGARAPDPGRP